MAAHRAVHVDLEDDVSLPDFQSWIRGAVSRPDAVKACRDLPNAHGVTKDMGGPTIYAEGLLKGAHRSGLERGFLPSALHNSATFLVATRKASATFEPDDPRIAALALAIQPPNLPIPQLLIDTFFLNVLSDESILINDFYLASHGTKWYTRST